MSPSSRPSDPEHAERERTPRRALYVLLTVAFCNGGISGLYASQHLREPQALWVVVMLLNVAMIYFWYYEDSRQRSIRPSLGVTLGIIGIAIVAVPIYLVRSRPAGRKLKALGGFTVFVALYALVAVTGLIAGMLLCLLVQ